MPVEVGQAFECDFQVSQEIVSGFGELFRDQNPLHVNGDYARSHGFDGRVVYGNVLSGYLSYLVGELLPIKNVAILSQKINFSGAVYVDDNLHLRATVSGFFEPANVIELKFRFLCGDQTRARGVLQVKIL